MQRLQQLGRRGHLDARVHCICLRNRYADFRISSTMSKINVLDFLDSSTSDDLRPWVVLVGGETFLEQQALQRILQLFFAGDDVPFSRFDETAEWRDVRDELATRSLFGGEPRLVVVTLADKFVSCHRRQLEDDVGGGRTKGVLVLVVQSWMSNTILAKAVAKKGLTIDCRTPTRGKSVDTKRILEWLRSRAKQTHGVQLSIEAARLLLELTGVEFGILDQNLAKLAVCTSDKKVNAELVETAVGGWSTTTAWDMIAAALDGDTAEALVQWDHLLQAGQHPIAVFAQVSFILRRLAAATRIFQQAKARNQTLRLGDALVEAGVRDWPPGAIRRSEQQLIQLGRARASNLYRWLLDTDLALKGTHSSPQRARWCIEHLFLRMAAELRPQASRKARSL